MRRILKALLGVLGLIALLLISWVACNNRWVDSAPVNRPTHLMPRAPAVAPDANVFFDLTGISAKSGQSPSQLGQTIWASRAVDVPGGILREGAWSCQWQREDCLSHWLADRAVVVEALASQTVLLQRCEAMADELQAGQRHFDEPMPAPKPVIASGQDTYVARPIATHVAGANNCMRGFQLQAVLAHQQGAMAARERALERAQTLGGALLQGSQSSTGVYFAWALWRNQLRFMSSLLVHAPDLAPGLGPMIKALPDQALNPRIWMAAEAFVWSQNIRELLTSCQLVPSTAHPGGLWPWVNRVSCLLFMPERSVQASDAWWEGWMALASTTPLAQLPVAALASPVLGEQKWPWFNTMGKSLLMPDAVVHIIQSQIKLQLEQQTAQLILDMTQQAIAPADRAAWLARQTLPDTLRSKLSVAEDGRTLRLKIVDRPQEQMGEEDVAVWAL